jgi:hypothetical protein
MESYNSALYLKEKEKDIHIIGISIKKEGITDNFSKRCLTATRF